MTKKTSYRVRRILFALFGLAVFIIYLIINPNSYQFVSILNGDVEKPEEISEKDETTPDSTLAKDVLESLAVHEKNTSEQ